LARSLRPGKEYPLGASFDGGGVNFAVHSQHATRVELCLFDDRGDGEERIPMRAGPAHVWHVYVEGLAPGQRYGFRAHGPYEPQRGHRFNPHKLLVDPYAHAVAGKVDYHAPVFGYAPALPGEERHDRTLDLRDDAWGVPKSVVVDPTFDWAGDHPPEVPWPDTVVYELHVKSFTRRHPDVPSAIRGTYLGVASDAAIAHMKSIGATCVELMPIHECADELFVARRGLTNYWGYSTLSYFAPDQRFASEPGRQVTEFKEMVKRLHAASIEVVIDVVYNHTCEGDRFGPTLSLRGLDNAVYYRLDPSDPGRYVDTTGTGNSLNVSEPQTLKLVMDSLRYWVLDMHVDGFRFDLAPTLARDAEHVDKLAAFFDIIHQDPVLSRVKLIAEPWDLGSGGYQVGNFPVLWSEWNGRYRDTVRRFWTGDRSKVGDVGYRLTGSSDLYGDDGRRPHASINFVTAHDGFTLRDLVSYEKKRNEANGEHNKDGWDDNASWNCGVEGETDDPAVLAVRARQERNFFATLYFSQGVPMITSGDEIGKTQRGNNNPYVQDNPISWLDWELDAPRKELLAFVQRLAAIRRAHAAFRRRAFLRGEPVGWRATKDAAWLRPWDPESPPRAIDEMTQEDWEHPRRAAIGLLLAGDGLDMVDDGLGPPTVDDTFLWLVNADSEPVTFRIPPPPTTVPWRLVVDTSTRELGAPNAIGDRLELEPKSTVLLASPTPTRSAPPPRSRRGGSGTG
jgi:glycogen operon protein